MSWNINVWLSYLLTLRIAKSLNYSKITFLLVMEDFWVFFSTLAQCYKFSIGLGSPEELTFQWFASSLSMKSCAIISLIKKSFDEQVSSIALFCSVVGLQCRKSQGIKAGVPDQEIITMNGRPLKRSLSCVWFITSHKTDLLGTSYPLSLLWVKPFKQSQSPVMHQGTCLCTQCKAQSSSL